MSRLTQDEVIERFKEVHGDRYDYSKVEYVNEKTKVIIICKEHGEFTQAPDNHKRGNGCRYCRRTKNTQKQVLTKFNKAHGDRYDYTKVKYEGVHNKIIIICKEHGEFTQSPLSHSRGSGCPKCWQQRVIDGTHGGGGIGSFRCGLSREYVITQFKEVHGDRYDYSKVEYVAGQSTNKIIIICKEHGEFLQHTHNHKRGNGCPSCANKSRRVSYIRRCKKDSEFAYKPSSFYKVVFRHKTLGFEFLKVGITSIGIKTRYASNYNDYEYKVISEQLCTNLESAQMEDDFLSTTTLEKFEFPEGCKFGGSTECFVLPDRLFQ